MEQPYLIVLTFYLVSWALDNWLTASCLPYQGNFQSPNWSIHAIYQVWLCEEEVEIQNIQEWTMSAQKETVYPIKFSMTFNQIRCENLSTGDWLSQYYNISKTTFLSTFQDKSDNKISTNTITYKFNFFFFFFFIQRQSVRLHTVWSICQSHMVYLDAISIMFCNQNWVQKKGKKWPHKDKEALTVHSQWACSHCNDSETRTNNWSLHQKSGFQQLTVVQDLMCAKNAIKKKSIMYSRSK